MNRRNLTVLAMAAALLVAGVPLAACGDREIAPEEHGEQPSDAVEISLEAQRNAGLQTEAVAEHPIVRVIETTGVVTPAQPRIAHIRPLARGIVEEVYVQLGDRVTEGQPLINYDNIELGDLIGEYLDLLGGLERLEAGRNVAEKFLTRAESLLEVEAIARSEFELRQAQHEQAVAEVESQKAEVSRVDEKLHRFGLGEEEVQNLGGSEHDTHRTASHNTLRAPFAGTITRYDVSDGEVVDRDRELFTIVDTSTVWVLADIYEKDLGLVEAGGEALISVPAYPDEVFVGAIEYVSDFLDPSSRTAKVRCVVANADGRLKLEMYATVKIPVTQAPSGLAIPIAALQQVEGATVVFVREASTRFRKRVVRIGIQGQVWAEVLAGLRAGETVVTDGSFYVKSSLLRGSIGDEH